MVADGELQKAGVTAMIEKRPISPSLLGKAALRIGAREAQNDLGLALASLGLVLAGLRRGPMPVSLRARPTTPLLTGSCGHSKWRE